MDGIGQKYEHLNHSKNYVIPGGKYSTYRDAVETTPS